MERSSGILVVIILVLGIIALGIWIINNVSV